MSRGPFDVQKYHSCLTGWLPSSVVVSPVSNPTPPKSHIFFRNILASYLAWLLATRTAKLMPHLWQRPQDIIYVPAFILFGYYFAIMKLYALCTLHEVSGPFSTQKIIFLTSFVDWLGNPCRYWRCCRCHRCHGPSGTGREITTKSRSISAIACITICGRANTGCTLS